MSTRQSTQYRICVQKEKKAGMTYLPSFQFWFPFGTDAGTDFYLFDVTNSFFFFLFVRSLPGSYDGERYIYRDSLRRFLIGLLRLGLVHGGSVNGIEDKHLPCSPRMDCLCVSVCTSV